LGLNELTSLAGCDPFTGEHVMWEPELEPVSDAFPDKRRRQSDAIAENGSIHP